MKKYFCQIVLALCVAATPAYGQQNDFALHFWWGTEFFPENYDATRTGLTPAPEELVAGYYVRYIQCQKVPTAADRTALEAAGLLFYGYVHFGAYLVAIPQHFDLTALARLHARSIFPVKTEWKLARSLRERPFGSWAVHDNEVDVSAQIYPHLRVEQATALLQQQGIKVLKAGGQNGCLQLRVRQTDLYQLAALPFVRYAELAAPPSQKDDLNGRSIHRANALDSDALLGKKFNGDGVSVLVRDDGMINPHLDLKGRLDNSFAANAVFPGDHGESVSGILGGAGNLDPTLKGMAAGVKLYAIDYTDDFQDETLPLHLKQNVTITNTSYSNGCNLGYTLFSQTVDQQMFENPTLMHVFSAGNSNGQDCGYGAGDQWGNITGGHKMAKNALATANVDKDLNIESSSSRGPAHDGRLKPDITAHGAGQGSLGSNNDYQPFGGTSAAAPGVAGCLAQLSQAFQTFHNGQPAPAALLKAALLNTANELGNPGPDFKFGWGLVNAGQALHIFERQQWATGTVDQGSEAVHTIQIPSNTLSARLMIVWADPSAEAGTQRALLNDLDLRATTEDGMNHLPWKLDPTPDETTLDTPAGKGRDSLNNVEQVVLENPAAGTCTVRIQGTEVPFGPQRYYLVWVFLSDAVQLTYPNGGEGLAPEEVARIHWDAFGTDTPFDLQYSLDNGASFQPIAVVSGDQRSYDWTVPATVSGQLRFLLLRDTRRDTSDFPSTISPIPQNLRIEKVCPDSMTLAWDLVSDTLGYEVYLLGAKYMEVVGAVGATPRATFPIPNPFVENWVSVRTSYPNGLTGRRARAILWPGGLMNCPQRYDASLQTLLSPQNASIIACSSVERVVQVRIANKGQDILSGLMLRYQANAASPVAEPVPDIAPGDSLDFSFQTPLSISANGPLQLRVWSEHPGDQVPLNDSLLYSIPASAATQAGFFIENFEGPSLLPDGWVIGNPDEMLTWKKYTLSQVIGSDGLPTEAMSLSFYSYDSLGREDFLYMVPIDLAAAAHSDLTFDLAHIRYDNDYSDSLRVEVFADCDITSTPTLVWGKADPELATAPDEQSLFVPTSKTQWRNERVSLAAYAGKKIIVRFVSVNGYGNNLFLDNIGIAEQSSAWPDAAFTASTDSICRNDTLQFVVKKPQSATDYLWNFGSNAQPATATGPGPHTVRYPIAGAKVVRLLASNQIGSDTAAAQIQVINNPVAGFTPVQTGLSVKFNDMSTNAATYLWDFGDGQSSIEQNPTHLYALPGNYVAKLTVTNFCNTNATAKALALTSSVSNLDEQLDVQILPNPTQGDFVVEMTSRAGSEARLSLLDAQGRLIKNTATRLRTGATERIPFVGLALPPGVYQLKVQTNEGAQTFRVVVQ